MQTDHGNPQICLGTCLLHVFWTSRLQDQNVGRFSLPHRMESNYRSSYTRIVGFHELKSIWTA